MAQTGTVTYQTAGASQITAQCEGVTSAAVPVTVTQPVPPPGGLYDRLPTGYTMPANFVCTFSNGAIDGPLAAEGSWTPFPASGGFNQRLRDASTYNPAGATAPRNPPGSPNSIGEVIDYAGMTLTGIAAGGMNGPSFLANGWRGIYLCYVVQLSSNWVSHPSGVNKIGFANINGFPMFYLTAQSAANWELHTQDTQADPLGGQRNLTANLASAPVTKGLWQKIQVQLVANTPGLADGTARAWLTNYNNAGQVTVGPTKTHEYTNVGWVGAGGNPSWQFVNWSPIFGGNTSGTLAAAQYMFMDTIALAGA